jgi:hypothetical protein
MSTRLRLSFVLRSDSVYSVVLTVAITLASAAPIKVPAMPKNEATTAEDTAARALAATCTALSCARFGCSADLSERTVVSVRGEDMSSGGRVGRRGGSGVSTGPASSGYELPTTPWQPEHARLVPRLRRHQGCDSRHAGRSSVGAPVSAPSVGRSVHTRRTLGEPLTTSAPGCRPCRTPHPGPAGDDGDRVGVPAQVDHPAPSRRSRARAAEPTPPGRASATPARLVRPGGDPLAHGSPWRRAGASPPREAGRPDVLLTGPRRVPGPAGRHVAAPRATRLRGHVPQPGHRLGRSAGFGR